MLTPSGRNFSPPRGFNICKTINKLLFCNPQIYSNFIDWTLRIITRRLSLLSKYVKNNASAYQYHNKKTVHNLQFLLLIPLNSITLSVKKTEATSFMCYQGLAASNLYPPANGTPSYYPKLPAYNAIPPKHGPQY